MPQIDPSLYQADPWLIVLGIIAIIGFIAIAVIWGIRAHRHQVLAGKEDLIGKTAIVRVTLQPKGMVFIQGEQWTAVSETGRVEPGEEVIISKVDSLKLYVAKKE